MFQRFLISGFFAVLAVPSFARHVLIPVVTGTAGNRTFRTTVVVTNRTNTAAECVFTYRSTGRPDHPLISCETIAAGQRRIYEDFLVEMSAAGTIHADCTADVELVTRLQESSDGGKTFRTGRLFRPFLDDHAIKEGTPGTTRAATDVAIAEVAGKPVHVEISAAKLRRRRVRACRLRRSTVRAAHPQPGRCAGEATSDGCHGDGFGEGRHRHR